VSKALCKECVSNEVHFSPKGRQGLLLPLVGRKMYQRAAKVWATLILGKKRLGSVNGSCFMTDYQLANSAGLQIKCGELEITLVIPSKLILMLAMFI